jgi:hypothetical protein
MSPNPVLTARNRVAVLTRHNGPDHPDTLKARAALAEAKLRRDIIAADDLDSDQRARLAALILGGAA